MLTPYVDPFIGTAGKGKTYPGATVPHGMVQLSPDNGRNGWDWISGYFYPDNVIAGFSHTHLTGTGAGDLYDISFMPLRRPFKNEILDDVNSQPTIVSKFNHRKEQATPGYYQVYLDTYDINVRLTAAQRSGYQEYTYSNQQTEGLVRLDLAYSRNWDKTTDTHIKIIDEYTVSGYRKSTGWAKDQRVYFYTRFSAPIKKLTIMNKGKIVTGDMATGEGVNALFSFDVSENKTVLVSTGISSVSMANAQKNLIEDNPNRTFDDIRMAASQSWEEVLNKVVIETDHDNMVQFYTALYHSHLAPRIYSDSNGEYKGPDGNIHQSQNVPRYSLFSLWDTFRALHPWKTITDEKRTKDMMTSLMAHYYEYGLLPVWNFQGNETDMMMGYHSAPVLVDAYLKGLTDINGEELLTALKKSANQKNFGIKEYRELGYVPYEYGSWNVSLTLEYAFDDWTIAQLAKALNKSDDYDEFMRRSKNYLHHLDSSSGFMRAKSRNGSFKTEFEPLSYASEDYCEANAWQYTWFVPHDIETLIAQMGGQEPFANKLDDMFTIEQSEGELPEWISGFIGQYVHGNEPSHHVPYLYQYIGQAHKTEKRVRQIMDDYYTTKPDGISGNEDAGQMSAWYLFSALGFYPVNPASGEYVIGSPQIENGVIHMDNGRKFEILVNEQGEKNIYVESVALNGKRLTRPFLRHEEIMAGGTLIFTMSDKPN